MLPNPGCVDRQRPLVAQRAIERHTGRMQRYLVLLLLAASACKTSPPRSLPPCPDQQCRLERYLDAYERKAIVEVENAPECVPIGQKAGCTTILACPAVVEGTSGNAFDVESVIALVGTDTNALADTAAAMEVAGSLDRELPDLPAGTHTIVLAEMLTPMSGYAQLHGTEATEPPERVRSCAIVAADACASTVGYVCEGEDVRKRLGTSDPVPFEVQLAPEPQVTALLDGKPTAL